LADVTPTVEQPHCHARARALRGEGRRPGRRPHCLRHLRHSQRRALQIYFFDHRCHIWPFRFQIDLLDSGINDLLDCSGKPCCTSIRALFAKEHRKTFGASVVFYPSIDCSGMLTQSTSHLFDMNEGSFGVPLSLPSIRHIDPKTSVKLQSEASCPESKAAMTTMVVDQSENSSPVKSPLKMWRLSD